MLVYPEIGPASFHNSAKLCQGSPTEKVIHRSYSCVLIVVDARSCRRGVEACLMLGFLDLGLPGGRSLSSHGLLESVITSSSGTFFVDASFDGAVKQHLLHVDELNFVMRSLPPLQAHAKLARSRRVVASGGVAATRGVSSLAWGKS